MRSEMIKQPENQKTSSKTRSKRLSRDVRLAIEALALLSIGIVGIQAQPKTFFRTTAAVIPAKKIESGKIFKNWGLANGKAKSHIQAVDAWKVAKGSKSIVVAVIDTGVDQNHPDLKANIWRGEYTHYQGETAEKRSMSGWDFVKNIANPVDEHGHGTHVAGIIGATANPKRGVSGVAQKVSIMGVKYYSAKSSGTVTLSNTVKAINYAIDNGAHIINYSAGGPEFSEKEYLAIKRAEANGILFVSAAGNERQNTDVPRHYYYPSAYGLSNIVSVAATDIDNKLLNSSNWGKQKVDLAAPGENIYSTLPNGKYGYMSGTSQATAFVSGVAALLLSKNPNLKPTQLKEILRRSVDRVPGLKERVGSGGRLNAYKALLALSGNAEAPNVATGNGLLDLIRSPAKSLRSANGL
jgi:thermitase